MDSTGRGRDEEKKWNNITIHFNSRITLLGWVRVRLDEEGARMTQQQVIYWRSYLGPIAGHCCRVIWILLSLLLLVGTVREREEVRKTCH